MQAAPGTPVGDGNEGSHRGKGFLAARRWWLLFVSVAVVALTADQVTKVLAVRHLTDRPNVEVVGDVLQLHLVYNPGAAFSLGTQFTVVLSCLAVAATLVVLALSRRIATPMWAFAMGFLLAGIDGNLADRIFRAPEVLRGHVVDFLRLPNWPIFNVADICINIGVALILVQVVRGIRMDGTREDESAEADSEAERSQA
ncbi:MAG: signal peptidase II [Nocardioidaceae bacterium]|nr:signal peptidase II [Nocardioidaceae bacterium]